ncbi:MAG TPA: hypothetical protein VHM67_14370 [Gemmatimonadaceae bacterium]|nr:hypothetical protein [Gemmatimonadaceae bacterium]
MTSLSRDLVDFLIELSIAMQKFAIYPLGHPMLATTTDRLERRLLPLLGEQETLSLGVAHNQLVIEGIATDEHHAVLRDLAQRLHGHHLGAVKISRGVDQAELREFLLAVGVEQSKDAVPIGLLPEETMPAWRHVRLFPLAYEHLELLEEEEAASDARMVGDRRGAGGARSARLWVGLARAALAGREIHDALHHAARAPADTATSGTSPEGRVPDGAAADGPAPDGTADDARDAAADPEAVARAIDEHKRDAAYDQVIVGYLLQIADELRTAEGRDAVALRARVSKLVSAMRPETLRTLLSMGNDVGQRRKFILDATQGMAVDAVLELLRAGADVSKQTVSHSMLRMLSKLAQHAGSGDVRGASADAALRDNVRMLVSQWSLDDPNPGAYREVLEGMSKSRAAPAGASATYPVEDERMVQMALEIGVIGESTWRAVDALLAKRRLVTLLALLERAPRPAAAQLLWDRLATTDRVRAILSEPQPDLSATEKLVARIGVAAAEPLIDALETERDTRRQTQIVNLLAKLGSEITEFVVRRLRGAPPELQMQLLALLGRLPELPAGFYAAEWAKNRSPLVRREAIKLLLRRPETRDQGITLGLLDDDERTILVALNQAAIDCPPGAIPVIMNRVDRDAFPAPLRALAIGAAAKTQSSDIVDWLLRFVMVGRKSFFGGERLAPKSPELLAALSALNAHWRNDRRAIDVLERARRSPDVEVRNAASSIGPRPSLATRAITNEKP